MEIKTHKQISKKLCGEPITIEEGRAVVSLKTTDAMAADEEGLVHGGFVFGMADYAAMLAVNEPFVVLAAANCKFTAPCKAGDSLTAKAEITSENGKRRVVAVDITSRDGKTVFTGEFSCAVLAKHVLSS